MSFEMHCANVKIFAMIAEYLDQAGIVPRQVFADGIARLADDAKGDEASYLRGIGSGIALADVALPRTPREQPQ